MKNNLLLIVILFNLNIFGQNENILKSQKEYFIKAEQALKNSNGFEALYFYHWVYSIDLNTNLEDIAKKRIDSLFPLYQNKEIEKWEGKWLLKQLKTNQFNYNKILITDKNISFYNKENDTIASRIEEIRSAKYNQKEIEINISSVVFKNNEIWEFNIKKIGTELRLFPKLKTDVNGVSYILLDHRGIIRDPEERKKALSKEIRTYYILEK